jgi:hypothetical protein
MSEQGELSGASIKIGLECLQGSHDSKAIIYHSYTIENSLQAINLGVWKPVLPLSLSCDPAEKCSKGRRDDASLSCYIEAPMFHMESISDQAMTLYCVDFHE